ncbi:MAG: ATP-dependent 6-phosphofructokinase [Puniceicoccaceae bacterium]|nr:MAG: ATP-dependent 6-phosphofructokinase [Puniceicoccaceae bacterium]
MSATKSNIRCVGILTSGGDCPGLNAAIRGVAKAALHYGIQPVGILDGFRGLIESRTLPLDSKGVSGILTLGGTLLGTSRDKPHKMPMGGKTMDMTEVAVANARNLHLDCIVCLGGDGTQKNAYHLARHGLDVITLPKTIDNDVFGTDVTFGFDTAIGIATEAIDRLHTTATSHHRIIVCELMGHQAGWLALAAGIAGGADVILIPEIPYDIACVAEHLTRRRRSGRRFSIVALAEGAHPLEAPPSVQEAGKKKAKAKKAARNVEPYAVDNGKFRLVQESRASQLARELQQLTGIDARVTALGHVQRGGSPSAADRLLCTRLGTMAGRLLREGRFNRMVAVRGADIVTVPLEEVVGKRKTVPLDHPWIADARLVETCFGDGLPEAFKD